MGLVLKRLPAMLATLLIVSFLTFLLTSLLPGDPAVQILGADSASDLDSLDVVREELRLDDPLLQRYGAWLSDVATGDLGRSFRTEQDVREAIPSACRSRWRSAAWRCSSRWSSPSRWGRCRPSRAGGRADRIVTGASFGLLALPPFMVAILLILIFAVTLGWLPATGWVRFTADPIEDLRHAILPALSLAVGELAVYTRLLRADMITTLQQDSITMARAKGIPDLADPVPPRPAAQLVLADDRGRPPGRHHHRRGGDHRDAVRPAGGGAACWLTRSCSGISSWSRGAPW